MIILRQEITAPFAPIENNTKVCARLDVDSESDFLSLKTLDKNQVWPILVKNRIDTHPSFINDAFSNALSEQFCRRAQQLSNLGYKRLIIAADSDSALHQVLSPRKSSLSLTERQALLLKVFQDIKCIINDVAVLLTVEELAPGGLDATDGIAIAQALFSKGLSEIIATSGTRDFMPLYDRRHTQKKPTEHNDFLSHEPSLAAGIWLLDNTDLTVWVLAPINNKAYAIEIAESLGLAGLIIKQ